MMNDAVKSCMDIENGNILDAIGMAEQLASFTNVSFGDTSSLDIEGLNFSSINTMVTEVNALSTMSVYDFDADATVAINALNGFIQSGSQSTTTECVR
jgi:hypothetical protein